MPIKIEDIAYYLPQKVLTNEDLHKENAAWDMVNVEQRSGVLARHVAAAGETALDMAVHASQKLLQTDARRKSLDCVIFCTQSGDHIMPPNACILHQRLSLPEHIFAFDINSACAGFVHGLALANGMIQSGQAQNVLLINADTYSKYIHPQDRSARVLFGDGASASWISKSDDRSGLVDIMCATSGEGYKKFIIPAGGCRTPRSEETARPITDGGNVRTPDHIHMDGLGILSFVNSKVPPQIRQLLERNQLTVNDIDLFVFHQASKMALDSLTKALELDPSKVFSNLASLGNLVSASIPIALKQALETGRIKKGDRVLISGFGVGLTWATAIIDF